MSQNMPNEKEWFERYVGNEAVFALREVRERIEDLKVYPKYPFSGSAQQLHEAFVHDGAIDEVLDLFKQHPKP
jgi:hypothetical protein